MRLGGTRTFSPEGLVTLYSRLGVDVPARGKKTRKKTLRGFSDLSPQQLCRSRPFSPPHFSLPRVSGPLLEHVLKHEGRKPRLGQYS